MEKFKNIKEFCEKAGMHREDLKDLILRACFHLLNNVERNFEEDAKSTAETAEPLFYFNEMLDRIE